jgi:hypothetical protein
MEATPKVVRMGFADDYLIQSFAKAMRHGLEQPSSEPLFSYHVDSISFSRQ